MKRLLWIGLGLAALLGLTLGVASAEPGDRVLSLGAQGDDVVELQQELTALGYHVPASGYYGTMTRRAVAVFQAQVGLPVTGKADGTTVQELRNRLADLEAFPTDDYGTGFVPSYGERYGPYATPWAPYSGESLAPYGQGTYGWGTPMGPGMMGGGMMGGMMGGGWGSSGRWGPGVTGGGWGSGPYRW